MKQGKYPEGGHYSTISGPVKPCSWATHRPKKLLIEDSNYPEFKASNCDTDRERQFISGHDIVFCSPGYGFFNSTAHHFADLISTISPSMLYRCHKANRGLNRLSCPSCWGVDKSFNPQVSVAELCIATAFWLNSAIKTSTTRQFGSFWALLSA